MVFDIKMTSIRTDHISGCDSLRAVQRTVGELFTAPMLNGLHGAKAGANSRRCQWIKEVASTVGDSWRCLQVSGSD